MSSSVCGPLVSPVLLSVEAYVGLSVSTSAGLAVVAVSFVMYELCAPAWYVVAFVVDVWCESPLPRATCSLASLLFYFSRINCVS